MKIANLNIRLSEELKGEFYRVAELKTQLPSALIRGWIERYVKEHGDIEPRNEG